MPKKRSSSISLNSMSTYVFLALFAAVLYLAYLVVSPFINALLGGLILAYLTYPLYHKSSHLVKNETLRAVVFTAIIFLLISIPILMLVSNLTRESVFKESKELFNIVSQRITVGNILGIDCRGIESFACDANLFLNDMVKSQQVKDFLTSGIVEVISFFTKASSTVLLSLPRLFLEFVIAILTMFYVLKDGKDIGIRLAKLSPLKIHHQKELVKRFQDILFAVVYGTLFVAVIQGIYAGVGFALFGVENSIIIGILVTFFALIPVVGTWVVWLPVVVYYILSASGGGDFEMLKWILLIVFGLSISTVDNIIKPVFIGGRARINALLVFVAAIGGVWFFGILGFIYGPIIIALAKVFFEIYEQEHLCPK